MLGTDLTNNLASCPYFIKRSSAVHYQFLVCFQFHPGYVKANSNMWRKLIGPFNLLSYSPNRKSSLLFK